MGSEVVMRQPAKGSRVCWFVVTMVHGDGHDVSVLLLPVPESVLNPREFYSQGLFSAGVLAPDAWALTELNRSGCPRRALTSSGVTSWPEFPNEL